LHGISLVKFNNSDDLNPVIEYFRPVINAGDRNITIEDTKRRESERKYLSQMYD